jgi:hypothetical protein
MTIRKTMTIRKIWIICKTWTIYKTWTICNPGQVIRPVDPIVFARIRVGFHRNPVRMSSEYNGTR